MRTSTLAIFCILICGLIIGGLLILDYIDYGAMDFEEYWNNPPCEFKYIDGDSAQLENCAVYQLHSGVVPVG